MAIPAFYIKSIHVKQVHNLKDVHIPISDTGMKHLILTGKNGSGKTSLLEALDSLIRSNQEESLSDLIAIAKKDTLVDIDIKEIKTLKDHRFTYYYRPTRKSHSFNRNGLNPDFRLPINLKRPIHPKINFLEYIYELKSKSSFAFQNKDTDYLNKINAWFISFDKILKRVFDSEDAHLVFEYKKKEFSVKAAGVNHPFLYLSDGYSYILSIITDILVTTKAFENDQVFYGVALIDEVETHLHINLQKNILPILTTLFPNIQFIVTTHSPFIINSISNAVVYDLEHQKAYTDLSSYAIDGIVEGYFHNDKYSNELKARLEEYRTLTLDKGERPTPEYPRTKELYEDLSNIDKKLAPELKSAFLDIEIERKTRLLAAK